MSGVVDFDLGRYIALRRGAVEQQAREGAAYAYSGEGKLRRGLASTRPVTMALEATTRLWQSAARAELLGTCVRALGSQFPRVHTASTTAGEALGVRVPPIYVAPATSTITSRTLGTDDAPYIILGASVAEKLDEVELVAVIGRELAHVQNNHVLYTTALHYLTHSAMFFVRWIVQPAIMTLQAWSRRADITCDRAALLATRDLDKTLAAIVKTSLGFEGGDSFRLDDYLRNVPPSGQGLGRFAELFRSHPYVPKRVQALRWFAEGAFYAAVERREPTGKASTTDVDKKVAELLSVF
jgi:Zn-dependent protease with chaperone function